MEEKTVEKNEGADELKNMKTERNERESVGMRVLETEIGEGELVEMRNLKTEIGERESVEMCNLETERSERGAVEPQDPKVERKPGGHQNMRVQSAVGREKAAGKKKTTFRHARIFLSVTAKEVCKGLQSGRFWLAVFAFLLLLMLDNLPGLYQPILQDGYSEFDMDIVTICENSLYGVGFMWYLRFCFYAVPFACSFYDEYSHRAAKYRLVRSSVRVYGMSKMAANIALSAMSVLVSELLFVGSLRLQGVEWLLSSTALSGALVSSLGKNHPIGYVLFTMAFKCLVAVYFASMVMMLSAFIRSRFVLLASPVALFFCLDSFSALWFASGQQPELTDWRTLFFSLSVNGTVDEAAAFARTGIYTACFVLLFGVVFVRHLRRVMENE